MFLTRSWLLVYGIKFGKKWLKGGAFLIVVMKRAIFLNCWHKSRENGYILSSQNLNRVSPPPEAKTLKTTTTSFHLNNNGNQRDQTQILDI
jgi:hypothetical protein